MSALAPRRVSVAGVLLLLAGLVLVPTPALAGPAAAPAAVPAAATDPAAPLRAVAGLRLDRSRPVTVAPRRYVASRLDTSAARTALAGADATPVRLALPAPDGTTAVFSVTEDSVLAPGIAARHPELRTYAGTGVTDPAQTIRLDLTPLGFHASVRSPGGAAAWYVDPAYRGGRSTVHLSYYGAAVPAAADTFVERGPVDTDAILAAAPGAARTAAGALVARRTLRLAFLTDPSYATYFGSDLVLAAKVSLINRVNQVYNDDLAISFQLIDGTDRLNLDTVAKATGADGPCGANACFTADQLAGCSSSLLTRNTFVLGQLVGADTFDLGHIGLGVNGGGIAGLGVVGGSRKAAGCTGLPKPQGDFYAIDYVAHEIGHQMGGNHTFNGTQLNCSGGNRNAGTSVEPGSGSSVMAYAGICQQDDLQDHTDPYFSQRSIDEITDTVTAATSNLNEAQTVNLAGFDTDGDSVQLTYPGATPVTITRGAVSYTALSVSSSIFTLTGCRPVLAGYDSSSPTLSDDGFRATFSTGTGCRATDLARLGIGTTTGGVTAFVGVTTDGGPTGNQGDVVTTTTNHAPTVVAPADKTIPARTPFTLTGSASDVDPGTDLTYLWEQNDDGGGALGAGAGTALVSNTKTNGPLFRVFGTIAKVTPEGTLESPSPGENLATTSPSRTFPDLDQVLADNTNAETGACPDAPADTTAVVPDDVLDCYSEYLPTAGYGDPLLGGQLDFRLTARDGFPTGGGTQYDDVTLTVDTSTGPFLVTSRAEAGAAATGGTAETVTWDVNGTDAAALAPTVKISVSLDGGRHFAYVVAAATPNDGSQQITLPDYATTEARIKVEAVGNYFFDVNDAEFTITSDNVPPDPEAVPVTGIVGGVAAAAFVAGDSARVRYASDQADATFACTLDGADVPCPGRAVTLRGLRPGMHRFAVAAVSATGVADPTPAARLFSVVHNEGVLARSARWKSRRSPQAYRTTYLTTGRAGQTLSLQVRRLNRVALLVGKAPGAGRLAVFLDGKRIATVNTRSARTRSRVLVPVESFRSPATGTLSIRTLDGKPVVVDGIGLFSRG